MYVYLSAQQRQSIETDAQHLGLSLSAFVRGILTHRSFQRRANEQLARELLRTAHAIRHLADHQEVESDIIPDLMDTLHMLRQLIRTLSRQDI